MKNRTLSFLIILIVIISFTNVKTVNAVVVRFPIGCSSGLSRSISTGLPCSGTQTPTEGIPGCSTPLGRSLVDGTPCDGITVPIQYLAGCQSIVGLSTITNEPCNGTKIPSLVEGETISVRSPGLPATGIDGKNNINILVLSGLFTLYGIMKINKYQKI